MYWLEAKRIIRNISPPWLWKLLNRSKAWARRSLASAIRGCAGLLGYNIARMKDYYSPLPDVGDLKRTQQRWDRPSQLLGIEYDLDALDSCFHGLLNCYYDEFELLPDYESVCQLGFGPGYPLFDALTLYMMIRAHKPKRYLEVGSGLSTYYSSLAAHANASDGHTMEIECIEPYPYRALHTIRNAKIHKQEVQSIDPVIFERLDANDILFIDSTHVLKPGGDVQFLYLEVLPRLKSKVLVHIHDVPFPFNVPYPSSFWVFGQAWPMFWNEAMVVQAFLSFNREFQILLSTPMLRHFREDVLKNVPIYQSVHENPNAFSALWLQRH